MKRARAVPKNPKDTKKKATTKPAKKRPVGRPRTTPPKRKYTRTIQSDYTETTTEREVYEKFAAAFSRSMATISVDDIEAALTWVGDSPHGLSLHPFLIIGFKDCRLASIVSWLLWVEAHCTSRTINDSGWGEWFCAKYSDCETLTGVSRIPIHSLMKQLRTLGVISTKLKGVPAMQHFRLDHSCLYTIIMESFLARKPPIPDALDASEWTRSVG